LEGHVLPAPGRGVRRAGTVHARMGDWPDRIYAAYVLDLDGTIYLGDDLLPGAARFVSALRAHGAAVRFVSNNPTRTPEQYAAKLAGLGLETPVEEVVNTTVVATRWLLDHHPGAVVFPIA